jgi:hypothetical protein
MIKRHARKAVSVMMEAGANEGYKVPWVLSLVSGSSSLFFIQRPSDPFFHSTRYPQTHFKALDHQYVADNVLPC